MWEATGTGWELCRRFLTLGIFRLHLLGRGSIRAAADMRVCACVYVVRGGRGTCRCEQQKAGGLGLKEKAQDSLCYVSHFPQLLQLWKDFVTTVK